MPEQFHFLQPWWFLALPPLGWLLWRLRRGGIGESPWRGVVAPHLLRRLLVDGEGAPQRLPLWLAALGALLAVTALAGPVWEKRPLPVFQRQQALVVVLDLSQSMRTPDLPPSRLARAKLKLKSLLRQRREGQTGLVVFAGDAFVVAPLTDDTRTIDAQLRALTPDLMPVQGSRLDRGLEEAGRLLRQAGFRHGTILAITDGYRNPHTLEVARRLRQEGYRIAVLGVGTPKGAPLPDGHGGWVRDGAGDPVVPRLDETALRALAEAGGGAYTTIRVDDGDLRRLLPPRTPAGVEALKKAGGKRLQWIERGPWLLLPLLPLAALAFRRGWLLVLPLAVGVLPAPPARAMGWADLWQRPDQRAVQALREHRLAEAARLARDPLARGSALYLQGKYREALEAFRRAQGPDAAFDRGNALARLGRFKEAIAAYEEALRQDPGMTDAKANKALLERLLRQQQRQKRPAPQQGQSAKKERQGDQGKQGEKKESQAGEGGSGEQSTGKEKKKPSQGGNPKAGTEQKGNGKKQQGKKNTGGSEGKKQEGAQGKGKEMQPGAQGGEKAKNGPKGEEKKGKNAFAEALKGLQKGEKGTKKKEGKSPRTTAEEPAAQERGRGEGKAAPSPSTVPAPKARAEALDSEERAAAEQWLRRIPDDPAGLLRRKFLYQYRLRGGSPGAGEPPW